MWLFTDIGFFSIVRKPGDEEAGILTIRARVREDLEQLKERYLPSMAAIAEYGGTDYPYRAQANASDLAEALRLIVEKLDYSNFKEEVAAKQGHHRASVYSRVWHDLLLLQHER